MKLKSLWLDITHFFSSFYFYLAGIFFDLTNHRIIIKQLRYKIETLTDPLLLQNYYRDIVGNYRFEASNPIFKMFSMAVSDIYMLFGPPNCLTVTFTHNFNNFEITVRKNDGLTPIALLEREKRNRAIDKNMFSAETQNLRRELNDARNQIGFLQGVSTAEIKTFSFKRKSVKKRSKKSK